MSHDPPSTTYKISREKVDSEFLRNKLKLKSLEAKNNLFDKYPHVEKFFNEKGLDLGKIREHSAKAITAGALTGSLLFAMPGMPNEMPQATSIIKNVSDFKNDSTGSLKQEDLLTALRQTLPQKAGALTRFQEKTLEQIIRQTVGINARATLEGEHLNTTYGYIGAEQHLARYQGDSMSVHPKTPKHDEGMAPGRGAWGYVPADKEKWYVAVQTLYLPDWEKRLAYVRDWYKYRKVLVINTVNGNAVVADIADAGPAAWTGKHFGGSPEVMNYLGGSRYKKGSVLVFFVDDPKNQVPLGPVDYNKKGLSGLTIIEG